jgi:hypothetical protein
MTSRKRAFIFGFASLALVAVAITSAIKMGLPARAEPLPEEPPIPHSYLLPHWHTARLDVEPLGEGRFQVVGTFRSVLAPLEELELFFETSDSLMVIGQPDSWQGSLAVGEVQRVAGVVELQSGWDYGYVTLAYDYDFPDRDIVNYIVEHTSSEYPDDELRRELLAFIRDEHRGRKQDGVTLRIERDMK